MILPGQWVLLAVLITAKRNNLGLNSQQWTVGVCVVSLRHESVVIPELSLLADGLKPIIMAHR
jgi:general stress protein CsbA